MMMGMGPRTLAWLREMEPFVRICHGHFPLKQCTLEADPHLVGINVCGLMAGKLRMENGSFSILGGGGVTISQCLKEREVETTVRVDKSAKTDAVLFLAIDAYLCSIKREKDGSPLRQQ